LKLKPIEKKEWKELKTEIDQAYQNDEIDNFQHNLYRKFVIMMQRVHEESK
jgi:hypothetical protein